MAKRRKLFAPRRRSHKAPARRRTVSGLPAVQGPRMPAVVTRVVRSGAAGAKKLAHKAASSAARASKLNKELNHEPQRLVIGAVAGDAVGYLVNKGITKFANKKDKDGAKDPKSFVNQHRVGSHLIVAGVAAAGAAVSATIRQRQVMHALAHLASFQLGSASAVDESKDKAFREVSGIDDSFNSAGPRDRMQARRQMIQSLASNVRKEDPAGTQGDNIEGYLEGLFDDVGEMVDGADAVFAGGETGVLPLALLANPAILNKAIPALSQLKAKGPDALQAQQQQGETPATDAVLALEGFDPSSMDVGSKRSTARKLRRAERKMAKAERKQRIEQSKEFVKSGNLIDWKQSVDSQLSQLQSAPMDEAVVIDE